MSAPRYLVVQLRQIGDVVLTTPIPRILKEERPGCHVSFLTESPSHRLLEGNPFIDEVIVSQRGAPWWQVLRFGRDLQRRCFDAVLDFMGNPRSALLSFLSGARVRVSYRARLRGLLYSHRVPREGRYAVEYKRGLLGPLGIRSERDRPEIFLSNAELVRGRELADRLRDGADGPLVTVDPTHRRIARRWPLQNYAELSRRMGERGWLPIVLWGPGEEAEAREVVDRSEGKARLAPSTDLRQLAALLASVDLHLGNCSAPRHIAVAVGTPTFTILGSTSPGWTHPSAEHSHIALGLECQPCKGGPCVRDYACLTDLDSETVFGELLEWTRQTLDWRTS